MKYNAIIILFVFTILNGCSNLLPRSVYQQPQVDMPNQWQEQTVTGTALANQAQWWKRFNDPVLDDLIDRALRSNNDLAEATIKVRRALLKSGLTDTNLTPSVSVSADGKYQRDLKQNSNSENYSVIGNLSYELDLWGRLESLRDADRWEAEATEADRQNTALSLIATTASYYWQIAYLNQQIALSQASIAYSEKTFDLVNVKYRAGAVSKLDLVQAQQSVETQKANLSQYFMQRTEARNALAILFDQAPENPMPERSQLPDNPLPTIEPGIPAEILGKRPDLKAAELRLRESLANIDATRASFYPTFTLTGSLGSSSESLIRTLQNPIAALGAGLVLPFVQWNTMNLNIRVSETQYEEAVVNFRQTLYKALSEVENALSANTRYQEEGMRLEQALSLAKQAESLLEVRYRAGAASMQSWLDAQESRRSAENSLAKNRLNRLVNLMKLYQAMGGDEKVCYR
jgi:NodT family efflux transporter outer membrane factor (OMF) lipoprotein